MANEAETGFAAALLKDQERLAKYLGVPPELRDEYLNGTWSTLFGLDQQPMTPERAAGYAALHAQFRDLPASPWGLPSCPSPFVTKRQLEARDRYPHVCPRCSGPAYVGAVEVDCAGGCK